MWCGLVWWMLLLNDCGFKTGVATSVRHPLNTEEKKKQEEMNTRQEITKTSMDRQIILISLVLQCTIY